ncbi:trigger factor [[Mycoplasma] gypis]|uniref:Trigger factor n=1 Tax=[Mycoplasma] gypis TaxID=92404 RepID=A0ABZ2RN30_9BACT|nr:trigger factor [[Mycoplasma] gypis]MBN0919602.1 trigger factor [[Mycoplasma] gypis]
MIKRKLDKKKSELLVTVTADSKQWKEEQDKARKNLLANLEVKGFRKGKVPASEAEKYISDGQVQAKAVQVMVNELAKLAAEKITEKDFVIDAPEWNIVKADADELVLEYSYPVLPEVKLGEYKDLGVKLDSIKVTDKDIDAQIQKMLSRHALSIEVEDQIKDGDSVNFDFKGFVDGEAFDGGEAQGFDIVIGSNQFIPGFEDSLKQFKKGDEGQFNVAFPAEYHMEALRGKEATFKVKINKVKRPDLPELNEEFIKSLSMPNITNLDELKVYLKDLTHREKVQQAKDKFARDIMDKIVAVSEYPLPQQIVRKEMNEYYKRFEASLKQQGATVEQYIDAIKSTKEKLAQEIHEEVVKNLKVSFTYTAVAKAENITVEESDYDKEYELFAKLYNMPAEEIKKLVSKEQIQLPLINKKIIAKLAEYNDPKNYKTVFEDEEVVAKKTTKAKKESSEAKEKATKTPAKKTTKAKKESEK